MTWKAHRKHGCHILVVTQIKRGVVNEERLVNFCHLAFFLATELIYFHWCSDAPAPVATESFTYITESFSGFLKSTEEQWLFSTFCTRFELLGYSDTTVSNF